MELFCKCGEIVVTRKECFRNYFLKQSDFEDDLKKSPREEDFKPLVFYSRNKIGVDLIIEQFSYLNDIIRSRHTRKYPKYFVFNYLVPEVNIFPKIEQRQKFELARKEFYDELFSIVNRCENDINTNKSRFYYNKIELLFLVLIFLNEIKKTDLFKYVIPRILKEIEYIRNLCSNEDDNEFTEFVEIVEGKNKTELINVFIVPSFRDRMKTIYDKCHNF